MKNIYKTGLLLLTLISLFGVIATMYVAPINQVNSVNVIETSFKPTTGAYVWVTRADGTKEDLCAKQGGWCHNVFTNAGKNATRDMLLQLASFGNFTYIGLCNLTAGCGATVTDTAIDNEHTAYGLNRQAGAYNIIQSSAGNFTVYKNFVSTADNVKTNMTGLLNQSSGGTLIAVVEFTDVNLMTNDQLAINWTCTAT